MSDDPYKYFRIEARELLDELVPAVLRLEKSDPEQAQALVERVMRLSHTLKGAAGVVGLGEISRRAHTIEDILGDYLDGVTIPLAGDIEAVLRLCDDIDAFVTGLTAEVDLDEALDGELDSGTDLEVVAFDERLETIRVDMEQMDALTAGIVQAGVEVTGLQRDMDGLDQVDRQLAQLKIQLETTGRDDGYGLTAEQLCKRRQTLVDQARLALEESQLALRDHIDRIRHELSELRDDATSLRLVPAAVLEPVLERAVRDAAQVRNKQVDFRLVGSRVRLDASVLAGVREALLHLVRNAVAHGIEPDDVRRRTGKARGQVEVHVERSGDHVQITCRDDGRGVDAGAVADLAVTKGLLSAEEAEALSTDEAIALLLGTTTLTTSAEVDAISGRGLGLSIVNEAVAKLHGQVSMTSQPGRGTEVSLTVPVSTAWMSVVRLAGDGVDVAIPLEAVVEVRGVSAKQVSDASGARTIDLDHKAVPFGLIEELFGGGSCQTSSAAATEKGWTTVVVDSSAGRFALGGRRVVGTEEVVVRRLPEMAQVDEVVSGAYLDAEGNPRLVIEPTQTARALKASSRPTVEASTTRELAPLLVIDDSLTTRMLLQSILETSGFVVETCSSAEEALERARHQRFEVFLVDVEMPGITGFEFVEVTRRDPELRQIPAILITSRNDPADRHRGLESGASDYIVKGEFDQGRLLKTLERITGQRADLGPERHNHG